MFGAMAPLALDVALVIAHLAGSSHVIERSW